MLHGKCPFCDGDMKQVLIRMLRDSPACDKFCTICTNCGEPMMLDKGTREFRKPTPDEYVELVESETYNDARKLWLQGKQMAVTGGRPPLMRGWQTFLKEVLDEGKGVDPVEVETLHQVFYSGAVVVVELIKRLMIEGDEEQLRLAVKFMDMECAAFNEMINEGEKHEPANLN